MTRNALEKGLVFVLFVLVLITFSFAERDTKKMFRQYNVPSTAVAPAPSPVKLPALQAPAVAVLPRR